LSYLDPPPMPTPVVVMKDVGGIVKDYQAQTEFYRRSGREVRLHECRSACTLALSLPNVCVYPDSVVKFHQAYNLRSRATDFGVSQQLFESYPAAIQARLGALTRNYKVLSGTELIALGIRNCNEQPVMLAAAKTAAPAQTASVSQDMSGPVSAAWPGALSGTWTNVMAALTPAEASASNPAGETRHFVPATRPKADSAENSATEMPKAAVPLPPPRPATDEETAYSAVTASNEAPLPPSRPDGVVSYSYAQPLELVSLPKVITGAQPILPARFVASTEIVRLMR
jgi:hypothetical protein